MSRILAPTPITRCLVRNEFLFDQASGHGDYTEGYIFGFRARRAFIPSFQVMLVNGAQWANVPIHMLAVRECDALAPRVCSWWDCFSDEFEVVELLLLRNLRVSARGCDSTDREGNYLFTVDLSGGWAEVPDQHKQHHIIALKSGQLIAYPNNKLLWQDESYVDGTDIPRYAANSHAWSVEGELE